MIHQFYKYVINLELYQYQEIPQAVVPYERKFERSLATEIRRFQNELHWNEMWTISEVYERLEKGYGFWVLRPKNQIKGWAWLSPVGELKNLYVSKWLRNQGWGRYLHLVRLNEALNRDYSEVFVRVDIWNERAKALLEKVISTTGCKTSVKLIEEEY